MGLSLGHQYQPGHTPLDEEEKKGLKIHTVMTKADLDEFEQHNIEEAIQWLMGRKYSASQILSEGFVRDLHTRMYSKVWTWAGRFRKTDKNLGIPSWQIATALKKLCDDALFWVQNATYEPDEIAIRFKHRIVSIHCFSNGNGRHSRLMADIIIDKIFHKKVFTWGTINSHDEDNLRINYLASVKEADHGHFEKLLNFARS